MEVHKVGGCISLVNLKQGLNSGLDFLDLSGVELVRLSEASFMRVQSLLEKSEKPCIGIHETFPEYVKLCGEGYDKRVLEEYLNILIPRAEQIKARYLAVGSPASRRRSLSEPYEDAVDQLRNSLSCICQRTKHMQVLLEGLNRRETNFIHTMEEAYEVIKEIPEENLGLVCDWYHVLTEEEDSSRFSPDVWGKIRYFHIADPRERTYPSAETSEMVWEAVKLGFLNIKEPYIAIEVSKKCSVYGMEIAYDQIKTRLRQLP